MATVDINDVAPEVDYLATASQTEFDIPFEFFDNEDLVVTVNEVSKALDTDYTVTGAEVEGGGTLTFTTALTLNDRVRIVSDIAAARDVEYVQSGNLPHDVLERDFQKIIRLIQQFDAKIGRSIRLLDTDSAADLELPLTADRADKTLIFGASGEVLASDTLPDSIAFNRSTIGQNLWPQTTAEAAVSVTPSLYYYIPGDVRRYGGFVSGSTAAENVQALQDALNAARNDYADENRIVRLPSGKFDMSGAVYGHYDASNNPAGPSDNRSQGRYTIKGSGSGHFSNMENDETRGTVLNFTSTTADGLVLMDYIGGSIIGRDVWMTDIGIRGKTSGSLVVARGTQWTHLRRFNIYNDGTGIALDNADANTHCSFKQGMVNGNGTDGTGIAADAVVSGGGNTIYEGVMVNDFDIALDWGAAFDGAQTVFAKNQTFQSCAFQNSRIGVRLRQGAFYLTFRNCWWEGNDGATGASVTLTDSVGVDENDDGGLILFEECHFADSAATAGKQIMQIGATGGAAGEDIHGPVHFKHCNHLTAPSGVEAFTKYNNSGDFGVLIENPLWSAGASTGRFIKLMSSAAHYGPVTLKGLEGLREMNHARIWVDSALADLRGRWAGPGSDIVADHSNDTAADYTNAPGLPSKIMSGVPGSNTLVITLPDNARVVQNECEIMLRNSGTTNTIQLDAGSGNTIEGDGSTTDSGRYCDMTTETYRSVRLHMRDQGEWFVYPIHGTIDMSS